MKTSFELNMKNPSKSGGEIWNYEYSIFTCDILLKKINVKNSVPRA